MRNEIVIGNIYELLADALEMSAKKLRTPSKTKLDENGLAPCGCGGKAEMSIETNETNWTQAVSLTCRECGIRIGMAAFAEQRGTEALANDAIDSWNTAMGWKE